jgi:hypothetical protein
VHEETQHQDCIEACGYRSATWRILRALKSVNEAKVVLGESAVTAAPFFENAGRPSKPFWGQQQGSKLVLWESLNEEDREACLKVLQKKQTGQCVAGQIQARRTKLSNRSKSIVATFSQVNARSLKVATKAEKWNQGGNM